MKFKTLLLLTLLAGSTAFAQSIAVNTHNTTNGTRVILTKNHKGTALEVEDSVAKSGLVFFSAGYQANKTGDKIIETYFIDLDMFHNDNKLGCVNQTESTATLILEDGTEIECFQISESDCGQEAFKAAYALVQRKGTAEEMQNNFNKLLTTGIAKIKVTTTEGSLDYKIKGKQTPYITSHFALVDKTLKGSVK